MSQEDNLMTEEQPTEKSGPAQWLQHVIGVFAAPLKTFEAIAAQPVWVFPLAIILIVIAITTYFSIPAIQADSAGALEEYLLKQDLTSEQAQSIRDGSKTQIERFSAPMAVVTTLLISLIASAVLFFVGNILLGGNAKYKQMFSLYCWSGLIGVLREILRLPISLQKVSMKVYFGPALLFPPEAEQTALYKAAAALDVFTVWRVLLLAVAFMVLYRFSFAKSAVTLFIVYTLVVAGGILLSGLVSR
ncbi:MAG: YIP1 family protein [bacterium]